MHIVSSGFGLSSNLPCWPQWSRTQIWARSTGHRMGSRSRLKNLRLFRWNERDPAVQIICTVHCSTFTWRTALWKLLKLYFFVFPCLGFAQNGERWFSKQKGKESKEKNPLRLNNRIIYTVLPSILATTVIVSIRVYAEHWTNSLLTLYFSVISMYLECTCSSRLPVWAESHTHRRSPRIKIAPFQKTS